MKFSVEAQNSSVPQFVMCMLHSVTNAHILHLQSRSFSEHSALGSFYSEVGDLIDSFVESYQGKYGVISNYLATYSLPVGAIAYLEYLKNETELLRKKSDFPADSELQNIVDEIATLINSTLYKLRFLK